MLAGIREIRLENAVIRLEEKRDQDIIKLLSEQIFRSGEKKTSFAGLVVSAKNLNISYTSASGSINADKVFFKTLLGSEEYELSLNAQVRGRLPSSVFNGAGYDAELRVRGTIDPNGEWATARVEFPEFRSDVLTIYDQNFQFLLQQNSLRITKVFDSMPLDLRGEIDLENGDMTFLMEADKYVPAAFIRLGEGYSHLAPWLTTSVSGRARLDITGKTGDAGYDS
ncbi:MAG: hypothetical protein JW874_11825, partial [Spirochaetales bacterium]|nr:hypothetical protein [Spirochaetales bacterium]